ncbi:MAG: phosphoribosylamine--glycine ligase, partial [bacterium]|nr:phosphoribosylamine--glycine ligase [bacterium]
MNVLLIGGGGREHAIAWKLAQSPRLTRLWIAPGNPGTAEFGENVDVKATDLEGIVALAERVRADLVVVGPEDPLAAGLVDRLTEHGIPAFGPSGAAAQLEASKAFAKALMERAGIATASSSTFDDAARATAYVHDLAHRVVVKADGLAAGKGVTVCDDVEQAVAAIDAAMRDRAFGAAGARVVIEERMFGRETSAHAFTDGVTVRHMPFSCDHKPIFDGDRGPNTGGMGVYSPPGWLPDAVAEAIRRDVTERTVRAMAEAGTPSRGVIYPGMMLTATGPRVVEFNARFGDPEAEVLLPRLRSDLLDIFDAVAHGRLAEVPVEWSDEATVGVMMVSTGYPGTYPSGAPIEGIGDVDEDVQVFMAGTARDDAGRLVTTGGRVLCVVAGGATVAEARERAYDNVRRISFEGAHYRTDIAARADEPLTFLAPTA